MNILFYFGHAFVCFLPTVIFGWQAGMVGGLYIEATQFEAVLIEWMQKLGWKDGIRMAFSVHNWKDTFIDLVFDAIGIGVAILLK